MKASDYIVEFLQEHGITDAFGYPGAVICHFMDSVDKSKGMKLHLNYHEQASAFAACGYAQASDKVGLAYSNGGPGATNLVTGIANAWYDAIPTIFIVGQVDTTAMKGDLPVRQIGIQEIPVTEMVKSVSKYAVKVNEITELRYCLERAYWEATNGRPGPSVIELSADIQRKDIEVDLQKGFIPPSSDTDDIKEAATIVIEAIKNSSKPCFLIGNGIKQSNQAENLYKIIDKFKIPAIFSIRSLDLLAFDNKYNLGFMGSNGHRYSNFVVGKSDLIISLGARLDVKQVGNERNKFALNAKLIRTDIDDGELVYKVREDEIQLHCDLSVLFEQLLKEDYSGQHEGWIKSCSILKEELYGKDFNSYHKLIERISEEVPDYYCITGDVGQHQIYLAQAFKVKEHQKMLFSTGLASMGYSLPAAIGAHYSSGWPVISFSGDGGIQMNMQELQFIKRENIPVKVIIFNNSSLGMIREFQNRNFEGKFLQSAPCGGYTAPSMEKIAKAYELPYTRIEKIEDISSVDFMSKKPEIIELIIEEFTCLSPRMSRKNPVQDMEPELDRKLYNRYMSL